MFIVTVTAVVTDVVVTVVVRDRHDHMTSCKTTSKQNGASQLFHFLRNRSNRKLVFLTAADVSVKSVQSERKMMIRPQVDPDSWLVSV